jgi:hypothetical protein
MPIIESVIKQKLKIELNNNLKDKIDFINDEEGTFDGFCDAVAESCATVISETLLNDLIITIPAATVITLVTGQAVGVPNILPIPCDKT